MRAGMRSIGEVLRGAFVTPALRRLQLAWTAVSLGLYADLLIVSLYAYDVGGAGAVGLVNFARLVPAALLTPIMGLAGDRFARRDVMLGVAIVRVLLCALVAVTMWTSAPLGVIAALSALASVVSTGYRPAQTGLLPLLATSPRQMAAANAVWATADSVGVLAGGVTAGAAVAIWGSGTAMLSVGALFLVAAVLAGGIPRDPRPAHRGRRAGDTLRTELLEGFSTAYRDRELRTLMGVLTMASIVEGALDTLIIAAALGVLAIGEEGTGNLYAAWGLGGIIGGAAALGLLSRGRLASGLTLGCLLMGLPIVGMGVWTILPVVVVGLVVYGIGFGLQETATMTLLQRLASDDVLARVFGVTETVYLGAVGIGAPIGALLISLFGVGTAFVITGVGLPVVALARWSALSRYEDAHPVPERQFNLVRGVPALAPLPVATLESLALRLEPVEIGAGHTITTQGEPGDVFYIVAEGDVEVLVDDRPVRTLTEGDSFGEIALVRRVPRTASVRALTAGELFALDGDAFVSAITGHPRSREAVDHVIEERWDGTAAGAG
jgi:MFS family permease